MLKNIQIESLYDLYDYTLDLMSEKAAFHFITGPNGYGKTTILNIIDALYNNNTLSLADIPLKTVTLQFDDGCEVSVIQEREYTDDDAVDEHTLTDVKLKVKFLMSDNRIVEETCFHSKDDVSPKMPGLSLYFNSHPVYYIRDGRMYTPDGLPKVKEYAEVLKKMFRGENITDSKVFASRLEAFHNIISRSCFAHKTLETDIRYGLRFVADNEDKTILPIEKLSSGEQHILIQAFEMLFRAPDDSLVLIDEPEMSFHMLWQVDYLKNLREITELRHLQCIVSTHSPQIFNMNWELTSDLYEQMTGTSYVTE